VIPFRRQKKREKEARKKNLKRARAASLGNAFSEIEQLLAFTVNPQAEQEDDTEEVTLEKIEECQEMLKSLQSRCLKNAVKMTLFEHGDFTDKPSMSILGLGR
jgi:hypothetical protein